MGNKTNHDIIYQVSDNLFFVFDRILGLAQQDWWFILNFFKLQALFIAYV